jgi:hypothetical protein
MLRVNVNFAFSIGGGSPPGIKAYVYQNSTTLAIIIIAVYRFYANLKPRKPGAVTIRELTNGIVERNETTAE